MKVKLICGLSALLIAGLFSNVHAQESSGELAKKLSNPISNLTSVPFQFNYDHNIGPNDDGERLTINVQPVIPFALSDDLTLISRTIVPIIYQDEIVPGVGDQFGLSDIAQSFFLVPRPIALNPHTSLTIGAGPIVLLPTATDDLLGAEKWGAGPTGAAIFQSGQWTYGALVNHVWSYAGNDQRDDLSQTFLNPFLAYRTPDNYTFVVQTETTYDWKADDWSVPLVFNVSKLTSWGAQPISLSVGARYWLDSTPAGPEGFSARAAITFLFPNN